MAEDDVPLRTDRGRLRDIIRLTADLVWETDREHRLTLLSDNSMDLLGQHSSVLLGQKLSEIWKFDGLKSGIQSLDWRQPFRNLTGIYATEA